MGAAALAMWLVLTPQAQSQQPLPTLRGTVVDARTNAPIADAKVTLTEVAKTTRTGPDGRFEFRGVEARTHTLTVTTIGYIFVRRRIAISPGVDVDLTIPLTEGTGAYQETVQVTADTATPPKALGVSSQMDLGSAAIAGLRGVGFDDPMRAIQALPGVATGDDFQAEFSVRGSAFRHVGIVIDGTPTQLLMHAIRGTTESGSVSMINSDVLAHAALFGGPHGHQDGDWLGATLQFDMREGSRDRLSLRAAVSGTAASGVFEGPIGTKHRGSWLVSVRRSYLDWLVRQIAPGVDSTIGFTDSQGKLVFDLTTRQQLQFTFIAGDAGYQQVETSPINGLKRANSRSVMGSLLWRYLHPRAVVSQRVSAVANDFANHGTSGQTLAEGETFELIWRGDVLVPLKKGWTLEGGARREGLDTNETVRTFQSNGQGGVRVRFERSESASPATTSGWGQLAWRSERAGFAAGVRGTDRTLVTRGAALPWVLGEFTAGHATFRAGVGRSAQFLDPLIVFAPPADVVPETAWSYDASVEQPLRYGFRVQATGFYRTENDVLRRTGEDRVDPITGQRIVETTFPVFSPTLSGTSKGAEIVLSRRSLSGPSGWVSYSWAHTRHHDRVTGETFDGDFDQRHTLNVFLQQRLSYRMTVSGKLRVGSGFPLVGYFSGTTSPEVLKLSTLRNQTRLPVYARLDLRANRTFTFQRSRLTLFVEVMNVLGRENLRQTDGSIRLNLDAVGYVDRLLPRVPSAGVLFEF